MSVSNPPSPELDPGMEKLNYLTHGLGFIAILIFAPFLIFRALEHEGYLVLSAVSCFILGALLMFGTSTGYHFQTDAKLKRQWRRADHMSIYVMIAGSYTPFMVLYLWNESGKMVLLTMWTLVLLGIAFKVFATGKYDLLSTFLYVLMGLSVVFVSKEFVPLLSGAVKYFLIAGGASYLVGVVFYLIKAWKFHHPVWHLFVMGGAFSHAWAANLALGI